MNRVFDEFTNIRRFQPKCVNSKLNYKLKAIIYWNIIAFLVVYKKLNRKFAYIGGNNENSISRR